MGNITEKGVIVKGYKATDNDIKCRGYQFVVGEWHEHDGDIGMCESGFHFCEYPSGPWSFYGEGRLWNVEAEIVLKSSGPGADLKHVAKRIRLVSEITVDGHGNTGHRNTGHGNTGHDNTGDRNTGHGNTGHGNTGDSNTGHGNIGDSNTGHGNIGDNHSGCFNFCEAKFFIFNKEANRNDVDFYIVERLSYLLSMDDDFEITEEFLSLPNASIDVIKELHRQHIDARSKLK